MTEEFLPKPRLQMPSHSDGGHAQTDLPLPEKEIPRLSATEAAGNGEQAAHLETSTPLPVVDGEVKDNKLKYLLFIVIAVIVLIGIAGGAYVMGQKSNTPTPTPLAIKTPTPSRENNLTTYAGDGFVFVVPVGYEIQRQTADETVWKSAFTPGQFNYASMILSSQALPFNKNQISIYSQGEDSDIKINETITRENENTSEIGTKLVTRYEANCGVDCLYYVVEFENNGLNYRLLFNGAGGGLSAKFDTLLESLNFSDTSTNKITSDTASELGSSYTNVKIKGIYGNNYALGSAGFTGTGGGIEFIAHNEMGFWKIIWRGNEAPGCSNFKSYPDFPKELNCDPNY